MLGRNFSDLCHLAWTPIPMQKPTDFRWTVSGFAPVGFSID